MKVRDLAALSPGAEWVVVGLPDEPIAGAYTSDMLSDVLAHAPPGGVLITIQAHRNTVAVAMHRGLRAIVLAHHRPVPRDMAEAAQAEGIAILRAPADQYTLSWRLHEHLRDEGVVR